MTKLRLSYGAQFPYRWKTESEHTFWPKFGNVHFVRILCVRHARRARSTSYGKEVFKCAPTRRETIDDDPTISGVGITVDRTTGRRIGECESYKKCKSQQGKSQPTMHIRVWLRYKRAPLMTRTQTDGVLTALYLRKENEKMFGWASWLFDHNRRVLEKGLKRSPVARTRNQDHFRCSLLPS